MSNPSATRRTSRTKAVLTIPFERTVNGIVVVADTILFTIEGVVPATCSAAEALKAYTMLKNTASHPVLQSYFADREPAY